MGEHPHIDSVNSAQNQPPTTYEEVLARHPDMHPGLHEHVTRLATEEAQEVSPPSIHDAAAELAARTAQLSSRSRFRVRRNASYIEFEPGETVEAALKDGNYTALELGELVHSLFAASTAVERHNRTSQTINEFPSGHTKVLHMLARHAQPETLQALYADSHLSKELRDVLEKAPDDFSLTASFTLLQKAYGCSDVLDLLDHTATDRTVSVMFDRPAAADSLLNYLKIPTEAWPNGTNPVVAGFAKREWGDRFLKRFVGLPEEVLRDMREAVYPRLMAPDNPWEVNSSALERMLKQTARTVKEIGVEKAVRLHEEIDTIDFDYYEADQLKRMLGLVTGDPATIEQLKAGKVTLVLLDGSGDTEGALRGIPRTYETPTTLCLEIHRPESFAKQKALLDKYGISPSTIVIGVHGKPGNASFNHKNPFQVTNRYFGAHEPRPHNMYSLFDSPEIAETVSEFMQDSRGPDDPPELKGRRRIILDACHLATPAEVRRPTETADDMPDEQKLGDLVMRHESLADTLVLAAAHPRLDVFGADAEITSYRKGDRVHYRTPEGPDPERPLIRTYLSDEGEIVHERVDSIFLAAP